MIPSKLLEGLNEQLTQLLGEGPQRTQQEVRNSINLIVQSAFARLELVTREEFDAQSEVLMRTRTLVDELELRVAELELKAHSK
ncbi:MAG: accessory factor UbiK family protein [Halopseudomonas sp.]